MSPNEIRERVDVVLKGASRSYAEDARYMAQAVLKLLNDYEQSVNNLTSVQARCTDLITNQRLLKCAIERIAGTSGEEREAAIADALVVAGGVQ